MILEHYLEENMLSVLGDIGPPGTSRWNIKFNCSIIPSRFTLPYLSLPCESKVILDFPGVTVVVRMAQWQSGWPSWSSKWQPTPVSLPGIFHVQRNLAGYSPWGCKQLDMTKRPSSSGDAGLIHRQPGLCTTTNEPTRCNCWSPCAWTLCSTRREATAMRSICTATREQLLLFTTREKPARQRRPSTAKINKLFFF